MNTTSASPIDTSVPPTSSDAARPCGTVSALVSPRGGLDVLSRAEIVRLRDASAGSKLHDLLRRCALAVLTTGSYADDARAAQAMYPDFDIEINQHDRGIKLQLRNAPAQSFVDGEMPPLRRNLLDRFAPCLPSRHAVDGIGTGHLEARVQCDREAGTGGFDDAFAVERLAVVQHGTELQEPVPSSRR